MKKTLSSSAKKSSQNNFYSSLTASEISDIICKLPMKRAFTIKWPLQLFTTKFNAGDGHCYMSNYDLELCLCYSKRTIKKHLQRLNELWPNLIDLQDFDFAERDSHKEQPIKIYWREFLEPALQILLQNSSNRQSPFSKRRECFLSLVLQDKGCGSLSTEKRQMKKPPSQLISVAKLKPQRIKEKAPPASSADIICFSEDEEISERKRALNHFLAGNLPYFTFREFKVAKFLFKNRQFLLRRQDRLHPLVLEFLESLTPQKYKEIKAHYEWEENERACGGSLYEE